MGEKTSAEIAAMWNEKVAEHHKRRDFGQQVEAWIRSQNNHYDVAVELTLTTHAIEQIAKALDTSPGVLVGNLLSAAKKASVRRLGVHK